MLIPCGARAISQPPSDRCSRLSSSPGLGASLVHLFCRKGHRSLACRPGTARCSKGKPADDAHRVRWLGAVSVRRLPWPMTPLSNSVENVPLPSLSEASRRRRSRALLAHSRSTEKRTRSQRRFRGGFSRRSGSQHARRPKPPKRSDRLDLVHGAARSIWRDEMFVAE